MSVVIVNSFDGDWIGLYVGGRLAAEGHSLAPAQVLAAVGIEATSREVLMDPYSLSRLPDNLSELP
jgi:hypothetical protein